MIILLVINFATILVMLNVIVPVIMMVILLVIWILFTDLGYGHTSVNCNSYFTGDISSNFKEFDGMIILAQFLHMKLCCI